jgi:hypothetical protein
LKTLGRVTKHLHAAQDRMETVLEEIKAYQQAQKSAMEAEEEARKAALAAIQQEGDDDETGTENA